MEFHNDEKKWLSLLDNKQVIGHIAYFISNDVLTIEHTIVDEHYKGQGLASKMTEELIKFATQKNYKIKPVCSYAVSYFSKHPEYSSLLVN
jgi:predicted GNAT family acetyltransferase